ncbi:MAG: NAD-dependent epimerase/dehydratase family protein [Pseudomonadota bacterium]
MREALIIGGSGQIGLGVARRLVAEGWRVRMGARTNVPGPWETILCDRSDGIAQAVGDGADLLLDCIAFDETHGRQLADVAGDVGHILAVSSASVYRDTQGRTLDEAATAGFPNLPVPIPEDHPTVAPGPKTYSTRKSAMELAVLDAPNATVLRPCAIHGPDSKHAREWWFVKRLLDGRAKIPLSHEGQSRFQTTSVAAIAEAVLWAIEAKPKMVNVIDSDAPTVAEIAQVIMAHMDRDAELVPLPGPAQECVGHTPWSTARAFVCASAAPSVGTYAETVGPALDWLLTDVAPDAWQDAIPQLAGYPRDHFDYATEDRILASL